MNRPEPARRNQFRRFHPITTRWHDNDVFGHVNNVVYYSFFDTAVTSFLLERGLIALSGSGPVYVVAETACRFRREIAFPDRVAVGMRIARLGSSSVRYDLAVFRDDDEAAAAEGHFVHVLVERPAMRPLPIPQAARAAFAELSAAA
jgi:acyl-CoA thioester hydrolase